MSAARFVAALLANALLIGIIAARNDAALAWIAVGLLLGAAMTVVMIEFHERQRHV